MDPVFIFYNNLKFEDNKKLTIEFSNDDRLQGVMFLKNNDYYLTSISCYIQLTNDLTELTHYDDVKKISDLSSDILKNGIDYLYIEKELEVTFGNNVKIELEPIKTNRALSVEIVEFFDYVTKQKGLY